jgi:hypothetical protein
MTEVLGCAFVFQVHEVPRARFYQVKIAGRGGPSYSYEDMVNAGWKVTLH